MPRLRPKSSPYLPLVYLKPLPEMSWIQQSDYNIKSTNVFEGTAGQSGSEMEEVQVRERCAHTGTVQLLWQAISSARQQRQVANLDRITKYMQREHDMSSQMTLKHLNDAVLDKLIQSYSAIGHRGSRAGIEQDGFKIPGPLSDYGASDWYCFECHKPGKMVNCSLCWRVFHRKCLGNEPDQDLICSACEALKKKPVISRKLINLLLSYTVLRLKEKSVVLHNLEVQPGEAHYCHLVFHTMDLNTMEAYAQNEKYLNFDQFFAHARIIHHNVMVCYGDMASLVEVAMIMIRDCEYDLEEIKQCADCYYYSNARPKDWFCQPCSPVHQLVYAKQKGFCYWPAKVVKVLGDGMYDVRFFGGWHQRATIPEANIKPIDTPVKSLGIKNSTAFTKASQELARHQLFVEQGNESDLSLIKNARNLDCDGDTDSKCNDNKDVKPLTDVNLSKVEEKFTPIKIYSKVAHLSQCESFSEDEKSDKETLSPCKGKPPGGAKRKIRHCSSEEDMLAVEKPKKSNKRKNGTPKENSARKRQRRDSDSINDNVTSSCSERVAASVEGDLVTSSGDMVSSSPKETCDVAVQACKSSRAKAIQTDPEEESCPQMTLGVEAAQMEVKADDDVEEPTAKQEKPKNRKKGGDGDAEVLKEEMEKLIDRHAEELSVAKKKQWCYNCEVEAMYHCCWNTSYCSIQCQQDHWHREHKRLCRRKR